jgi:Tfp pilus assembly protein PilV
MQGVLFCRWWKFARQQIENDYRKYTFKQRGFSVIEFLIAVLIMFTLMGLVTFIAWAVHQ